MEPMFWVTLNGNFPSVLVSDHCLYERKLAIDFPIFQLILNKS